MELSSGVVALTLCALSVIAIEALAAASKGVGGLAPLGKYLRPLMPSFDVSFGQLFKAMLAVGVFGVLALIVVSAIQQVNTNPPPAKSSISKQQASLAPMPARKCTLTWKRPPGTKGYTDLQEMSIPGEITDSSSAMKIVLTSRTGMRTDLFWDKRFEVGTWTQTRQENRGDIGFWHANQVSAREYTGKFTGLMPWQGSLPTTKNEIPAPWIDFRVVVE